MNTEYEITLPNDFKFKVKLINEPPLEETKKPEKLSQSNKYNFQSSSCLDFIRENYLKKGLGLVKERNTDLYKKYCIDCDKLQIRPNNKESFYQSLKDVEILLNEGKYNGYRIYNISLEKLQEIASKHNNFEEPVPETLQKLYDEIARLNEVIEKYKKTEADLEQRVRQLEEIDIDNETLENISDLVAQL